MHLLFNPFQYIKEMWLDFLAKQLEEAVYSQPKEPTKAFRAAQKAVRAATRLSELPKDLLAELVLWSMDRAREKELQKIHSSREETWEAQALSPTDRLD